MLVNVPVIYQSQVVLNRKRKPEMVNVFTMEPFEIKEIDNDFSQVMEVEKKILSAQDYRYRKTRVVDVTKNFSYIQHNDELYKGYTSGNGMLAILDIMEKYRYNGKVKSYESLKYLQEKMNTIFAHGEELVFAPLDDTLKIDDEENMNDNTKTLISSNKENKISEIRKALEGFILKDGILFKETSCPSFIVARYSGLESSGKQIVFPDFDRVCDMISFYDSSNSLNDVQKETLLTDHKSGTGHVTRYIDNIAEYTPIFHISDIVTSLNEDYDPDTTHENLVDYDIKIFDNAFLCEAYMKNEELVTTAKELIKRIISEASSLRVATLSLDEQILLGKLAENIKHMTVSDDIVITLEVLKHFAETLHNSFPVVANAMGRKADDLNIMCKNINKTDNIPETIQFSRDEEMVIQTGHGQQDDFNEGSNLIVK